MALIICNAEKHKLNSRSIVFNREGINLLYPMIKPDPEYYISACLPPAMTTVVGSFSKYIGRLKCNMHEILADRKR